MIAETTGLQGLPQIHEIPSTVATKQVRGQSDVDEDQAEAMKELCKSYQHTITKILYGFAALCKQQHHAKGSGMCSTNVSNAVNTSKRSELMEYVYSALATGVERIVRSDDLPLRTGLVKQLKERLVPPKPAVMCDQGAQTIQEPRKPRKAKSGRPASAALQSLLPTLQTGAQKLAITPMEPTAPVSARSRGSANTSRPTVGGGELPVSARSRVETPHPEASPLMQRSNSSTVSADSVSADSVPTSTSWRDVIHAQVDGRGCTYERQRLWDIARQAKVAAAKAERDEQEMAENRPMPRKKSRLYEHVKSAVRQEHQMIEAAKLKADEEKLMAIETQVREAQERFKQAEDRASRERQERLRVEELLERGEASLRETKHALQVKHQELINKDAEVAAIQEFAHKEAWRQAEQAEIAVAMEGRRLEVHSAIPNKRVLRVNPLSLFDGKVSSEYRIKDVEANADENGGVSFLMGHRIDLDIESDESKSAVQCVLFEKDRWTELEIARWWAANRYRVLRFSH